MRVDVDGLTETKRALGRMPRDQERALEDASRDLAKATRRAAVRVAPGSHPSAPSSTAWIQQTGPSVTVNPAANARAVATEFGMNRPSRGTRRTGRRQFNRHRSDGYVVGRVLEDRLRKADDEMADDSAGQMRKTLNRAGVPRG